MLLPTSAAVVWISVFVVGSACPDGQVPTDEAELVSGCQGCRSLDSTSFETERQRRHRNIRKRRAVPKVTIPDVTSNVAITTEVTATDPITIATEIVSPETSQEPHVAMKTATQTPLDATTPTPTMLPREMKSTIPPVPPKPDWRVVNDFLPWSLKGPFYTYHRICDRLTSNPDLEVFKCSHCKIEFFPLNCLKKTPKLKQLLIPNNLYLRFNLNVLLHFLPYLEVLDLTSQRYLDIEYREDIRFPPHKALKILKLSNNLLVRDFGGGIRLDFRGLRNLRELELEKIAVEFLLDDLQLSGLEKLEKFVFSDNHATMSTGFAPEFVFQKVHNMKHLNFAGNKFGELTEFQLVRLFQPIQDTLEHLNLERNGITNISAKILEYMPNLKKINLAENLLKIIPANLFHNSHKIESILLYSNRITFLEARMFIALKNLTYLSIADNEFRCNCAFRQFRDWGHSDGVMILGLFSHGERCFTDKEEETRIFEYKMHWIDCDYTREYIILGAIAVFLISITTIVSLIYRYRYDILWWILKRRRRRNVTSGERYHAFVSYNSQDSGFTISMIKYLEQGDDVKFKLSFDGRFDPAEFISDCIVQCIERSEKIIFVISRRFLKSEWCSYELRMGELKCFEERRNIMILIFLEKIPVKDLPRSLRTLVRQINYLQWPVDDDDRAKEVFWKRLKIALSKDAKLSTRPDTNANDMNTVV